MRLFNFNIETWSGWDKGEWGEVGAYVINSIHLSMGVWCNNLKIQLTCQLCYWFNVSYFPCPIYQIPMRPQTDKIQSHNLVVSNCELRTSCINFKPHGNYFTFFNHYTFLWFCVFLHCKIKSTAAIQTFSFVFLHWNMSNKSHKKEKINWNIYRT